MRKGFWTQDLTTVVLCYVMLMLVYRLFLYLPVVYCVMSCWAPTDREVVIIIPLQSVSSSFIPLQSLSLFKHPRLHPVVSVSLLSFSNLTFHPWMEGEKNYSYNKKFFVSVQTEWSLVSKEMHRVPGPSETDINILQIWINFQVCLILSLCFTTVFWY